MEKYEVNKAEGTEKINWLKCMARESAENVRGRYEKKVAEEKIDEYKSKRGEVRRRKNMERK